MLYCLRVILLELLEVGNPDNCYTVVILETETCSGNIEVLLLGIGRVIQIGHKDKTIYLRVSLKVK